MEQDIADAEEFIAMGDNDYVAKNISLAQKRVEKANKAKPKSVEMAKRIAELQAINEEKLQAQAELDRWKKVQEEMERRANTQTQEVEQEASNNLTDNVKTDSGKEQIGESTEKVVGEDQSSLSNNEKEVGSASEVQNEQSATDNTLREVDKSDNPKTPNGNVSSTSSLGEDSKKSEETKEGDIKEQTNTEETLENGDKKITNYNSRGEVATVATERKGKIVSVDSYDEGILFEHTDYDENGQATSVTRYDKKGNVIGSQEYVDGKKYASSNSVNQDKRFSVKGEEKRENEKESVSDSESESGEKGEIDLSNKHWVVRLTEEEKREEIAQLSEELGVEIHAIQDVSELPETEKRAKEAIEKGGGVRAWVNVNSGEVYVYMPNVETATSLRESVLHEVVGHKGLSELYKGDEKGYETKIKEIWDMMRPEDKSYYLDYALRYNLNVSQPKIASIYMSAREIGLEESLKRHGVDVDRVKTDTAEEYVAHLAEWGLWNAFAFEGTDKSVWRKMVDFVLDKVFKFNAPEVEVAKLLYNSRHNYEKMKRNIDPLVTAEESVNKDKVNKFADDKIEDERRRFSVLSKDAYDRKREWAARRMANNAEIGQANGLTEEQTDLLEKLASLRHELHTSQDSYISGNSDILKRLVALNKRMAENDIAMPFIPTDTSDYIDIDNIDILRELDWDNEIPESDTEEYQDWYDETYNRIYGELEDLNRQIESFLGGIDERYGTSYRPSGYTRFSVSRDIEDKEVKNVILVDTEEKKLPTTREEALAILSTMSQPFRNEDMGYNIYVSNSDAKHTMSFRNQDQIKVIGGIDEVIRESVKIGELSVDESEKKTTKAIHIFYCPVNIDKKQYSARLVVKEYFRGNYILDQMNLYNMQLRKEKVDETPIQRNAYPTVLSPTNSVYKVKDLIHNTQENDKKLLGIENNTRFSASRDNYKTKKGVSQRVMNIANSLHSTSETDGATLSDAKIPQMFEISKQEEITPKNTTIDDVLRYSIKVNHNSPYLLKKADGSFVDPETGERLGFDHRFMGKGEGAQVHGYGSCFSVNDLRHYGDIRRKQIKKVKFGTGKWYEFGQSSSEDSEGNVAIHVMDKIDFHGNSDNALAYSKKTLEHNKHALDMARVRRTYQLSKATDATEKKEIAERIDEEIARLENEIKFTEKVISFLEQLPYTTPSKIKYKQEQDSAHHYEVEIPDNTGSNYIREKGLATKRLYNRIIKQAKKEGLSDWYISIMEEEKGNAGIYPNKIYERTAEEFEYSERKASEFLSRAGIVGIHYYGGRDGECYVIFNENDAKIVDHTRFSVKEAVERELAEIKAKAIADGTFMKAPNGKPSNLKRRQWLHVRLKSFKKWFGDWEKAARIEKLRKSKPLSFTGKEYEGKYELNNQSAERYILDNLRGEYSNKDTGEKILISRKGANKVSHHDAENDIHLKSIAYIPQMIENATFIAEEENLKSKNGFDSFKYYVVGLNIGGENYTAKLAIGSKDGQIYYDHALTEIEKSDLINQIDSVERRVYGDKDALSGVKDKRLVSILQTNSSKVVDENGEPMEVWHGGKFGISTFTPNRNMHFGTRKAAMQRILDEEFGYGDWLVRNEDGTFSWKYENEYDESYNLHSDKSFATAEEAMEDALSHLENEYAVKPYFLNIRNIKRTDDVSNSWDEEIDIAREENAKIDGIVYENVYEDAGSDSYIAFDPNQIKSSTDNVGTYDSTNPDIRFSVENKNQEVFVSNAQRAVEGIKQDKATPEQWLKMIEKQGGLKAGEDKWLGLSDWLKASDNKSITKQEILDFIGENKIEIEEVSYGNDGLRRLQGEFDQLLASNGGDSDSAFEEMIDRYGEDFGMAIYVDGTNLSVSDGFEDYLELFSESRGINSTRLDYTTEGLENKREIALTVPTIESWNESDDVHFGDAGEGRAVAWVRFGETTDSDGNRVLVIDEIQSKRHQEGREKGYKSDYKNSKAAVKIQNEIDEKTARLRELAKDKQDNSKNELVRLAQIDIAMYEVKRNSEYDELLAEENEIKTRRENRESELFTLRRQISDLKYQLDRQINSDYMNFRNAVPDAPFEKNWHELAMKRMLRLAAEEGYDKVAWTKGEQQAKRYGIGKVVDEIQVSDNYNGEHEVRGYKNGELTLSKNTENGEQGLAELIGKEMARKAYSNLHEGKTDYTNERGVVSIKGNDLMVGGEGMKGFYDEILPRFMNKYGKKWGTKVEDVELPNVEEAGRIMHSVDVTEEMKESVMEGQVMFSVKRVNDKFNAELQQQIDGTLPKGHIYQLGMPSEILRRAGIPNLKIEMAMNRLADKSMQENHPFDLSEVKNLPNAIQNPLAVFVSATHLGSNVILTELTHGGKNFVVALRVSENRRGIMVNDIRSLYPKNIMSIIDWINNDLATYVDKGRMIDWLEKRRNELLSKQQSNSAEVRKQLVSATKIVKDFENPSVEDGKTRFSVIKTSYNHTSVYNSFYKKASKKNLIYRSKSAYSTSSKYIGLLYGGVDYSFRFANHSEWDFNADPDIKSNVEWDEFNHISMANIHLDEIEANTSQIIQFMNWVKEWNEKPQENLPTDDDILYLSSINPMFKVLGRRVILRAGEIINREKYEKEKDIYEKKYKKEKEELKSNILSEGKEKELRRELPYIEEPKHIEEKRERIHRNKQNLQDLKDLIDYINKERVRLNQPTFRNKDYLRAERDIEYLSKYIPREQGIVDEYDKIKDTDEYKKQLAKRETILRSLDLSRDSERRLEFLNTLQPKYKSEKEYHLFKSNLYQLKLDLKKKAEYEEDLKQLPKDLEGEVDGETIRFKMSRTPEEFEATQRQAVEEKGIVMPGLNNAIVNVVDVPRHDFTGTGKDALRKAEDWSNKNIVGEHIYHKGQEDEFKYTIDKDAIDKFLSKSSTTESDNLGVHLAVLKKLPEVIDNSIEVEIHPDYKKVDNKRSADNGVDNEDLLVHRMYGAVSIDGRIYRAKTTIHEFKNKDNRAYDYKITEVELIISGSSTSNALNSSTSVSATKILKDVEKTYDKGKKVLEVSENLSNGTRFSVDISREMYNREMGRTLSKYKEGWIDSMRSLLKAQEAIVGNGELADYENAYYAANTMSSKATAKARLYEKQYVQPMLKEVSALIGKGSSYEEVGQYVKTKHGLERNRDMSLRSALKEEFKPL